MPTHRQPRRSLLLRNVLLAVVVISIILSANSLCYGMPTPDEESFSREVSAKERLLPAEAIGRRPPKCCNVIVQPMTCLLTLSSISAFPVAIIR